MRWTLLVSCVAACAQTPPHADVIASGPATGLAVLVLPTTCASPAHPELCSPAAFGSDENPARPYLPTFAAYIDPALRLKLELAGFTLAEGAAMRLVTADRVDTEHGSQVVEGDGPRTVADLPMDDVLAVARSLDLTGVIVSRLAIHPARYGMVSGELVVALVDVATNQPGWTVTCSEVLYNAIDVPSRLASCAGNGVLAALSPENLIGEAL